MDALYIFIFNHRHSRNGHLFQNRYKSILCQGEVSLKELIRYIHLNPLWVGIVRDLEALDSYPYAGHMPSWVDWQSVDSALSLFDTRLMRARRAYRKYVAAGVDQGKRWDLIGGGLIRSAGGWSGVRSLL